MPGMVAVAWTFISPLFPPESMTAAAAAAVAVASMSMYTGPANWEDDCVLRGLAATAAIDVVEGFAAAEVLVVPPEGAG